jgi:hypothetical protein
LERQDLEKAFSRLQETEDVLAWSSPEPDPQVAGNQMLSVGVDEDASFYLAEKLGEVSLSYSAPRDEDINGEALDPRPESAFLMGGMIGALIALTAQQLYDERTGKA